MKKYFITAISLLVVVNFIILSCTPSESSESNVVVLPSILTTPVTTTNQTTATLGGNLLSSGNGTVLSRGVCYSTSSEPTTADSKVSNPGTLGTYNCVLSNLTAGTQYYARAYASNIVGTAYGEIVTFTTTLTAIVLPTVTTASVSNVTETSALSGGEVTSIGGGTLTARGLCWGIAPNPTIADNVINDAAATIGTFTSSLIDLTPGTVYYARAFATNSGGTGYGAQVTFTTMGTSSSTLPVITTTAVTSITETSALSGGNVTSAGTTAITTRGLCWSTQTMPTTADNIIPVSGTAGSFGSTLSGLTPDTDYYVRAYATNSAGTAYGAEIAFTTLSGPTTNPVGGDAICDGSKPTAVVNITSMTGKIWMDRNLGASRAATMAKDFESYGCLYQWGRGNDGHASINWIMGQESIGVSAGTAVNGVTQDHFNTDSPNSALFVADDQGIYDWRDPQNDNLWQGVSGINNPCPIGYRVPTQAEFQAELAAYSITGTTSAFNSIHKFPIAGDRAFDSGAVRDQGLDSAYWTSTIDNNDSFMVRIESAAVYSNIGNGRSGGHSVRCIKN